MVVRDLVTVLKRYNQDAVVYTEFDHNVITETWQEEIERVMFSPNLEEVGGVKRRLVVYIR